MTDPTPIPRRRLGFLLWVAGMIGVAVITVTVLPQMLERMTMSTPLPAPLPLLQLASLAQSGLLLALAIWSGVALAPAVGLRAPAFEAAVSGHPIAPALRPQLLPGLVAGMLGGALLFVVLGNAPTALAQVQGQIALPLLARVLYGGITEELLLRWGLMTALVWLAWRFLQHRQGTARAGYIWVAIGISALIFGVGHLPAAGAMIGSLDASQALFVVGANTLFGLLFGYLYWRYGLETAMIAHALAHVVASLANLA